MWRKKRRTPRDPTEENPPVDGNRQHEDIPSKLLRSEEALRILYEYAPDAIYASDLKGTFVIGNAAAERITGYSRGDLIGRSLLRLGLLGLRDVPRAAALLARNAAGQSTGPDEFILHRKDGSEVPVEISTYPVRIQGQWVVIGIARDVSERERAARALGEAETRFRTLMEQSPLAIEIMSVDGRIVDVNAAFLELWGLSKEDMQDVHAKYNTFEDEQLKSLGLMPYYERAFAGETLLLPPFEYDVSQTLHTLRQGQPEGRKRWIQPHIYPLISERGQISNIVSIHDDITERKGAEEALTARMNELQSLYDIMLDREDRNLGLKREINELLRRLGEPIRYPSAEEP